MTQKIYSVKQPLVSADRYPRLQSKYSNSASRQFVGRARYNSPARTVGASAASQLQSPLQFLNSIETTNTAAKEREQRYSLRNTGFNQAAQSGAVGVAEGFTLLGLVGGLFALLSRSTSGGRSMKLMRA